MVVGRQSSCLGSECPQSHKLRSRPPKMDLTGDGGFTASCGGGDGGAAWGSKDWGEVACVATEMEENQCNRWINGEKKKRFVLF